MVKEKLKSLFHSSKAEKISLVVKPMVLTLVLGVKVRSPHSVLRLSMQDISQTNIVKESPQDGVTKTSK